MVATKMDAHVIYDSTPPLLLSTVPVHNAAGVQGSASEPNAVGTRRKRCESSEVGTMVNISLIFDEDIQAREVLLIRFFVYICFHSFCHGLF